MREDPTRRKVLKGLAATAAIAGGAAILSQKFKIPEEIVPEGQLFKDGTRYSPEHVEGKLSEWYRDNSGKRLFENLNFGKTQKRYAEQVKQLNQGRRTNFTREGVPDLVKKFLKEGRVHRFEDEKELEGPLGKKFLVPVEEVNASWRCRGVGMDASPKNNKSYLRLAPKTADALQRVAEKFQKKIVSAGLAEEWGVRFTVNSLVRTQDPTDKTLAVYSSPDSPHLVGMGFDI